MNKSGLRYAFLDRFRGLVLISMIIYHTCWDLVYIFGMKWSWYQGPGAYVWQQSICWSFIFLSGFCWSLGRNPLKRGLLVSAAGAMVSIVTLVFMPENKVVFGVLTLIGTCMLIMLLLENMLKRVSAGWGCLAALMLFVCTKNINEGYLGFEAWNFVELPEFLYQGKMMTFLGFMEPGFYSTDYFSLFPWIFLFLTGYFSYRMIRETQGLMEKYLTKERGPVSFLGRHSLPVYILHQPVVFGFLWMIEQLELI